MKRTLIVAGLAAALALPVPAAALTFGTVDASKIFNNYAETRKTKTVLESEKAKLQVKLDGMKKELAALDDQYTATAKKLQETRAAKKEAEAQALEGRLRQLRETLQAKQGELQKFFESSQKQLYELEDQKMGSLGKLLDEKVDATIKKVAASKGMEAVFEKRFCYFGGDDITEAVLAELNAGMPAPAAPAGAAPAPAPAPKKPGK